MSDENISRKSAVGVGVCPKCGRPLTQLGPNGECLRCVFDWGFASDSEESGDSTRSEGKASRLRYGQFEVEMDADGFPVGLGAGAMAVTYRARDTILNSIVALKVISRKLAENPIARVRFLREARAAAQIHHPNVARVTHYGEEGGEYFYAMELVEGETLEARVQRTGPLPLSLALEIIEQAARGLAAAEVCGVVHRDIKPSNLMIESDPSGLLVVKIIDYGLAKVLASQADENFETRADFVGTPAFASPEQFIENGQKQIDARSDIYSLGVTLWYLLTSRTPFNERTHEQIRSRHNNPPFEQLKAAHVPGPVIALLKSMLATDPKDRPQSARELLAALHRCCVRFNPETRVRRRRTFVIESLLVLAIVAIALGSWWYQHSQSFAARDRSIAVLPFENLSSDKENAFFTDGVQDEVLTHLAKIADLKVISRTSVMQYKSGVARNLRKIGDELGVAHVVEGSVQRAGNKVRVNAQLIDARNDSHLWAQTYDRDLADVFAIQSEIARAIADQLQAKLSPNEKIAIEQPPTTDLAAFDLYSRAKSLLTATFSATGEPDMRKAIELLDQAVKRDPLFFDAYRELAYAHEFLYGVSGRDHTPARLALAEAALQAAERLRPDAAETHLVRARYLYYGRRDYAGALAELESVRRALPNDPNIFTLTGYILRRRGDQEGGLRNLQRAAELDPRNSGNFQQIALTYQNMRRYGEAIAAFDRALSIEPNDVETRVEQARLYLCWKADIRPLHQTIDAILAQGPTAIASTADGWFACALAERDVAAGQRALAALGDNPSWIESTIFLNRSFGEGLLARMTKDEPKARSAFEAARAQQEKIVEAQPDYGPALCVLAMIDAGLGRKELALEEGRRAIALTPMEKDATNGSFVLQYFAITAAWVGEKELALEQLETGLRAPAASQMVSYGAVKLLPFWDPLRGDPRFEALVQRLAPTASK